MAPDSINEIFDALKLFKRFAGKAYLKQERPTEAFTDEQLIQKGEELLENNDPVLDSLQIVADCFENSKRKVLIIKVRQSYQVFKKLITLYAVDEIVSFIHTKGIISYQDLIEKLPAGETMVEWLNIGGQLIPKEEINDLKSKIHSDTIASWDDLHQFYADQENAYPLQKLKHALASLQQLSGHTFANSGPAYLEQLLDDAIATREWMMKGIYDSRAKDYSNPFRQLVYDSIEEMNTVIGSLEDNSFINEQENELLEYKKRIGKLKKQLIGTEKVVAK